VSPVRFQFIDRIDAWEPYRRVTGCKVTSAGEGYWRPGPAGRMVMPHELALEAVCQAASWLIVLSSRFTRRAVPLSVREVTCCGDVTPGDVLSITAAVTAVAGDAAMVDGSVEVAGRQVLRVDGIMCGLRDAQTMDTAERTAAMARQLLRAEPRR
jgi:3-hydroxyacyl-[acyl-carrier-protein] dehydratase